MVRLSTGIGAECTDSGSAPEQRLDTPQQSTGRPSNVTQFTGLLTLNNEH